LSVCPDIQVTGLRIQGGLPGLRGEVFVVGCLLLHPLPVDEVVETGGAVAAVLIVFFVSVAKV